MQYFLSEGENLLDKLWTKVLHVDCVEALQVILVCHWTHHCAAVSLREVLTNMLLDFIFAVVVANFWKVLQSSFEVLSLVDLDVLVVD